MKTAILASGFNLFNTMSEIRADIFTGDNSAIFSLFIAVGSFTAAISLIKLTNDMTLGKDLSPLEIARTLIISILVCNFSTLVLTPLESISSSVGKGVTACFHSEKLKTRHLSLKENVYAAYDKFEKKNSYSGKFETDMSGSESESIEGLSMDYSLEGLAEKESEIDSGQPSRRDRKIWQWIKSAIAGVAGVWVRSWQAVVTEISCLLVNIVGYVITGMSGIYLIVLGLLGPLVFALSMIPAFQNSLWQWVARYIQISLWTPLVYIVQYANMKLMDAVADSFLATATGTFTNLPFLTFIVISLISFCATLAVPSMAAWIVQSTGANNVQKTLTQTAATATMVATKLL